ncbi:MAG TPA: methyltransferase [Micromonosporaceae bacterium]|nr:methyltransferase [Micromonosporaceae bacterium]
MFDRAKRLLGYVPLYIALQRGVGADRLRYRCLDEANLGPGDCVIDIGCGPAYYFPRIPAGVRYFGFDTDPNYIEYARKRWGDRGDFRCEIYAEEHVTELPQADVILLLGLLHHLSDEHCRQLLDLTSRALTPNGVVISVDPCFEPNQGRISRWMSRNDRGEYVREIPAFTTLAQEAFADVDGDVVDDATRIPSSHWMMRMRKPVAH